MSALLEDFPENEEVGWRESALCRQTDPDLWFPPKGGPISEAKRTCRRCPVRQDCLEYALEAHERYGIWGGYTIKELARLRRSRRSQ